MMHLGHGERAPISSPCLAKPRGEADLPGEAADAHGFDIDIGIAAVSADGSRG